MSSKAGKIRNVVPRAQSKYSQRHILALTPTPASNPLDLAHPAYGLPKQLVGNFASVGLTYICTWQCECLLKSGVLGGDRDLVYTAPTGGRKSLIVDIILMKKLVQIPGKRTLLILPSVALAQEKIRSLGKLSKGLPSQHCRAPMSNGQPPWPKRGDEDSVRVVGFFVDSRSKTTWEDADISVCTTEKVVFLQLFH
jgi:DNA polymerase theta